jgi:single-strand DNA-binding protein
MICGRITRDPEIKALPSGIKVCTFGVASNRTWKGEDGQKKEEVEFHNVVAFGKTAETIKQWLLKGDEIYVEGRLKTSSWEAKDGSKRYKTDIMADTFQFGAKKREDGGGYSQGASREGTGSQEIASGEEEINLDDIPF